MRPLMLIVALLMAGCCTTGTKLENGQCFTVKALKMQEKADRALLPETQRLCAAAVDKCGKVAPDKCPAYGKCVTILTGYKVGMNAAGRSLEAVHKLLEDLKTLEVK